MVFRSNDTDFPRQAAWTELGSNRGASRLDCFYCDFGGLVQDYSISIANALGILQSCTKPSICCSDRILIKTHEGGHNCYDSSALVDENFIYHDMALSLDVEI